MPLWDSGLRSVQSSTEPAPSLESQGTEPGLVQGHDSGAPKGKSLARRRSTATPMIPIGRRSKHQDRRSQQGPLWLYPSQPWQVCTSQKTTSTRSEAPLHPFENNGSPWSNVANPCISYRFSEGLSFILHGFRGITNEIQPVSWPKPCPTSDTGWASTCHFLIPHPTFDHAWTH